MLILALRARIGVGRVGLLGKEGYCLLHARHALFQRSNLANQIPGLWRFVVNEKCDEISSFEARENSFWKPLLFIGRTIFR